MMDTFMWNLILLKILLLIEECFSEESKELDYINAKTTIDKVNEGLDSLNHIAKTDGISPTVYTFTA